ncbi:Uncharacterised protein [Mycobacterium tuberculosis]|nr:Uncharacterised protein [Mycobacterium tuberculosis]
MLPPTESRSVRRLTGTIATSGVSGSASLSSRYSRSAPAHIASTTSLRLTPAASFTALTRSNGQDCAAQRRAPPTATLSMVCGAPKGSVNCCSINAERASRNVEGASPATDPSMPPSCCRRPRRRLMAVCCVAGDQAVRNLPSMGSVVIGWRISVSPDTPSTRAWCIFE